MTTRRSLEARPVRRPRGVAADGLDGARRLSRARCSGRCASRSRARARFRSMNTWGSLNTRACSPMSAGCCRWKISRCTACSFVAGCLLLGFVLAVLIDRQVRAEAALRTAFLYPYAMSFVATGVVWQWLLNPSLGIQEAVRRLGLAGFQFDWIVDPDKVIYTIAIATIWQASRARDGDHAGGAARYRSGNLEGGASRRHSGVARVLVDRPADARALVRDSRDPAAERRSSNSTMRSSR